MTQWQTLIDVSQHATDDAARSLHKLNRSLTDAQTQCDALQSYRQDYAQRIAQAARKGLSASNYHNFRRFIRTLDDAIVQQNDHISKLHAQSEQGRLQWMGQKRKLNAYQTLQQRQQDKLRNVHNRCEQRQQDEFSLRCRTPY